MRLARMAGIAETVAELELLAWRYLERAREIEAAAVQAVGASDPAPI